MSEPSLEQRVADKFTAYKQGTFYINDHVNMRYARDVIALVCERIARDIEDDDDMEDDDAARHWNAALVHAAKIARKGALS